MNNTFVESITVTMYEPAPEVLAYFTADDPAAPIVASGVDPDGTLRFEKDQPAHAYATTPAQLDALADRAVVAEECGSGMVHSVFVKRGRGWSRTGNSRVLPTTAISLPVRILDPGAAR